MIQKQGISKKEVNNILKGVKNINFWARELRLPLFWMMNRNHKIFSENVLFFYKNNVMHFYYLNDKEKKAAEIGYKFFTNAENVKKYELQVSKIIEKINKTENYFKEINIDRLSDKDFKKLFFDLVKALADYVNIYSKTEELFLIKIGEEADKYKNLIKKLGGLRFLMRKKGEGMFYLLLGILLKGLSKRTGVKVKDLFLYTDSEISNLFSGKKVKNNIIYGRSKGYAILVLNKKRTLLVGDDFKKSFNEVMLHKKDASEIKGMVAMKGFVRGKIKLILHTKRNISKEVKKFKKGEILVTEMTRPDTILACRKAAAIITDEGGITSHAAIISREFKIPCIIGTKIATQILKTGDLAEVDAINGIVKILK